MNKQLISMTAVAAMAGAALAVESKNVVGYTEKVNVGAGKFALGAIQFQKVGGTTANINDILTCSVATPDYDSEDNYIDGWYNNAAVLEVRSGDGYVLYYYCSQAERWNEDLQDYEYIPGWTNDSGNYSENAQLASGIGVWFKGPAASAATFKVAGQVNGEASASITGATGFNLIANPFPVAFNINSDKISWGLTGTDDYDAGDNYIDGWYNSADVLEIRSGDGYVLYYYCSQAERWNEDLQDYEYIPGWTNDSGNYSENVVIPAGEGFWLKAKGSFTAVASK